MVRFPGWQWVLLALAGLRHGGGSMDTPVSLGVVAATAWSVYTMFAHGAGEPVDGMWGLLFRPAGSISMPLT